jgi:hypothetical protein
LRDDLEEAGTRRDRLRSAGQQCRTGDSTDRAGDEGATPEGVGGGIGRPPIGCDRIACRSFQELRHILT